MRFLATCLAIISALSTGFNLPAYAANQVVSLPPPNTSADHQKILKDRERLIAQLANPEAQAFRIYDAQGVATTFERSLNDPKSFREGMILEHGNLRVRIRGEFLENGKNGILLLVTREVDGRPMSGQTVTLKPGMTKLEFENRIQDLALSLAMDIAANKKSNDRSPAANADAIAVCFAGVLFSLIIVAGAIMVFETPKKYWTARDKAFFAVVASIFLLIGGGSGAAAVIGCSSIRN